MITRCWRWLLLLLLLGITPGSLAAPGAVWVLGIDDAIGPASADYLVRSLDQAKAQGAQLVVIRMSLASPGSCRLPVPAWSSTCRTGAPGCWRSSPTPA